MKDNFFLFSRSITITLKKLYKTSKGNEWKERDYYKLHNFLHFNIKKVHINCFITGKIGYANNASWEDIGSIHYSNYLNIHNYGVWLHRTMHDFLMGYYQPINLLQKYRPHLAMWFSRYALKSKISCKDTLIATFIVFRSDMHYPSRDRVKTGFTFLVISPKSHLKNKRAPV